MADNSAVTIPTHVLDCSDSWGHYMSVCLIASKLLWPGLVATQQALSGGHNGTDWPALLSRHHRIARKGIERLRRHNWTFVPAAIFLRKLMTGTFADLLGLPWSMYALQWQGLGRIDKKRSTSYFDTLTQCYRTILSDPGEFKRDTNFVLYMPETEMLFWRNVVILTKFSMIKFPSKWRYFRFTDDV